MASRRSITRLHGKDEVMPELITTRQCTKCKTSYPLTDCYRNKQRPDGRHPICKHCMKAYLQSPAGRRAHRAACTRYSKTPTGRDISSRCKVRYRANHPDRAKAHNAVMNAVGAGILPRARTLGCTHCFAQATQYHHYSYAQEDWLNVVPICRMCHNAIHH